MARKKFLIIKSKSLLIYNPQIILYISINNILINKKTSFEIKKLDIEIA